MKELMAVNEKILNDISATLEDELKRQIEDAMSKNDPDLISDKLVECKNICNKLLTHDYFERSEHYLDRLMANKGITVVWDLLYDFDLNKKQKDLRRLFNLIINYSEDWC